MTLAVLKDACVPRMTERLIASAVPGQNGTTWRVTLPDHTAPFGARAASSGLAGEDLYQGRLGIAWTLLEAAEYGGNEHARDFALDVLQQSLLATPEHVNPLSAYTGGVGAGWVAARAFVLTNDRWFLECSRNFIVRALRAIPQDQGIDVIAGSAGIVPCALEIFRWLGDESARDLAVAAGKRILQAARIRHSGWSWRSGGGILRQELCGFAHGASGFVFALLELFATTGDSQWAFGAMRGLSYEHRHFRDPEGDWPDFRDTFLSAVVRAHDGAERLLAGHRSGNVRFTVPTAMRAWCHGSPGGLPVRRRAQQLGIPLPFLKLEESLAAAATRATLLQENDSRSYSLCHGFAGNGECLLAGPANMIASADRGLVLDQLLRGADLYENQGRNWPSGAALQLPDPSLMVGDAGVLLAALRMLDDTIPSVLFRTDWGGIDRAPTDLTRSAADEIRAVAPSAAALSTRCNPSALLAACWQGATLREALANLKTGSADSETRALVADALVPIERRLDREDEIDDFGPLLLRELLLRHNPTSPDATGKVVQAADTEIVTTRWAWRDWQLQSQKPDEKDEYWISVHRNGRIELEPISEIEALALSHAMEPIVLEQLVALIVSECEAVDLSTEQLATGIRNLIQSMIRRALLSQAASGE